MSKWSTGNALVILKSFICYSIYNPVTSSPFTPVLHCSPGIHGAITMHNKMNGQTDSIDRLYNWGPSSEVVLNC